MPKTIKAATFSKPTALAEQLLGRAYVRVKIRASGEADGQKKYFAEFFTETQAFHRHFSESEVLDFIEQNSGRTFRHCVTFTDTEEISVRTSKKGRESRVVKKIREAARPLANFGHNRRKNHILPEGVPVPFLVALGVMTAEGKVVAAKYDKFRQVNRFLEFIADLLPQLVGPGCGQEDARPLRIIDFGSGKSYLTFATHYFLTRLKNLRVEIVGLDLKREVIEQCSVLAGRLGCEGLSFQVGDIAGYKAEAEKPIDLMVSLHACDTATDLALEFAVKNKCRAILSVPCCQHELNGQLAASISAGAASQSIPVEFGPLLRHGLLREKFASLATDALRAAFLETQGYSVQMLEFIDLEHTPKNILIRATLRPDGGRPEKTQAALLEASALLKALRVSPAIWRAASKP